MRIIGLDYGDSRIGVAVSDSLGLTAQPVCALSEKTWTKQLEKLGAIVEEYGAEGFVIGMPKNMNGTEGPRADVCKEFAQKLREATGLPVNMWDERRTTVEAHNILSAHNYHGQKRKNTVDAVAASLILEGYLAFRGR